MLARLAQCRVIEPAVLTNSFEQPAAESAPLLVFTGRRTLVLDQGFGSEHDKISRLDIGAH